MRFGLSMSITLVLVLILTTRVAAMEDANTSSFSPESLPTPTSVSTFPLPRPIPAGLTASEQGGRLKFRTPEERKNRTRERQRTYSANDRAKLKELREQVKEEVSMGVVNSELAVKLSKLDEKRRASKRNYNRTQRIATRIMSDIMDAIDATSISSEKQHGKEELLEDTLRSSKPPTSRKDMSVEKLQAVRLRDRERYRTMKERAKAVDPTTNEPLDPQAVKQCEAKMKKVRLGARRDSQRQRDIKQRWQKLMTE